MTTYYISPSGSNANTGLGPDASHATNKPWLTLGKAMNLTSVVLPGDTVYLGPGILYEGANTITPVATIASAASPTSFIGDPTNAQGFKTAGGVLLAPAPVVVTPRTSGNGQDVSITSTADFIAANTNSVKGVTLKNFMIEAYMGASILRLDYANTDWILQDMVLLANNIVLVSTGTPTAARNWTFQRCEAFCSQFLALTVNVAAATADANLNITIDSCRIWGRIGQFATTASGGNLAGGITITGCHVTDTTASPLTTFAGRVSTVAPITVTGCVLVCTTQGGQSINAATAGHITGSYNRLFGPVTNYTLGTGDVQNPMPHVNYMSFLKWGLQPFRADEIYAWSPGATSAQRFSAWSNTSSDFKGRTVRPWGAGASIGDIQSVNMALDATSAITGGGTYSGKMTGQGEVSIRVYVPAGSYTISVVTKSTSYGGTNYPQLIVEPNVQAGVARTTVTASDATEQTLTTGTLTLSIAAFLEVRLVSRSSTVSSTTHFDTLTRA